MHNGQNFPSHFGGALRSALLIFFEGIPSPTIFAREFNLRSPSSQEITPEVANSWIKGEVIPDFERLAILRHWLALDLNALCLFGRADDLERGALPNQHQDPDSAQFIALAESIGSDVDRLLQELQKLKKNSL